MLFVKKVVTCYLICEASRFCTYFSLMLICAHPCALLASATAASCCVASEKQRGLGRCMMQRMPAKKRTQGALIKRAKQSPDLKRSVSLKFSSASDFFDSLHCILMQCLFCVFLIMVSYLSTLYLTAESFRKLVNIFDNTRVLVRSGLTLNVILQLLSKLR